MSNYWCEWKKYDGDKLSPYLHWWLDVPPLEFTRGLPSERANDPALTYFLKNIVLGFNPVLMRADGSPSDSSEDESVNELIGETALINLPLPGNVKNHDFKGHISWIPDPADLPSVSHDTVIVGIVDAGIPVGSSRYRDRTGKTRVLAAWQQGGARAEPDESATPRPFARSYLPSGTEIYKNDIDCLLAQNTINDLFLADSFNREAGLVDIASPLGVRVLAGRYAHGASVLDLAAGVEPHQSNDRTKIIAVNLPNLATLNNSSTFLDYFTILGIKRIADLADAIYEKSKAAAPPHEAAKWTGAGFPVVINLSFGKNAGAKDGNDFFSAAITKINARRVEKGRLPIQLVASVGNHNLRRVHAQFDLKEKESGTIAFRTAPEDQTPNFLEVWSDRIPMPSGKKPEDIKPDLYISVTQPGATTEKLLTGKHHHFCSVVGDPARIYCAVEPSPSGKHYRVCYMLCLAPSMEHTDLQGRAKAPAGAWQITVRNKSKVTRKVFVEVQTDQSGRADSKAGRQARLEHAGYSGTDQTTGRVLDSCDDPGLFEGGKSDTQSVLRRHGTINATAMGNDVIAVAGYRRSDGQPARYSSTGHGFKVGDNGREEPSFAAPTDDSPALFGVLTAGAAEGSVVAMRGTSFASAQTTRIAAELMLGGVKPGHPLMKALEKRAIADEAKLKPVSPTPCATKVGKGRVIPEPHLTINRKGG
ncbi:MAG: S8 family serine peptidase [Beijerinckiaceae bacterium]